MSLIKIPSLCDESNEFKTGSDIEKTELHIKYIIKFLANKFKISSCSIKVINLYPPLAYIDRLFSFYNNGKQNIYAYDFKTDYRAYKSGNIAIELISSVDENCFKNALKDIFIRSYYDNNEKEHAKILKFIEDIRINVIEAKMGFGLPTENLLVDTIFLSYLIQNPQTKSDKFIIYNIGDIHSVVEKEYKNFPLFLTSSFNENRKWITIGSLIPISFLKKIEQNP